MSRKRLLLFIVVDTIAISVLSFVSRCSHLSCRSRRFDCLLLVFFSLRIRRICSTNATFQFRINELKTYLLARGYRNTFLDSQFLRAYNISRTDALQTNRRDSITRIPFVVTYNQALPHFSDILRKHFNILLSSDRCRDVFKHPPIVAYRRTSNLRDILVKAQVPAVTAPNSTNLPPGSFRCGQDCATCPCITNGLKHYTFCSTGETRNMALLKRGSRVKGKGQTLFVLVNALIGSGVMHTCYPTHTFF